MYTSFSPNNERFGFRLKGRFKCAFQLERTILIAGLIPMALIIILMIVAIVFIGGLFNPDGGLKGGYAEVVTEEGYPKVQFSDSAANYTVGMISIDFLLVLLAIFAAIYIAVIIFMRVGRYYTFDANENGMTIRFPSGREESFLYKDVMGVTAKERKFLWASRGLDITIKTRFKNYTYHLIHTPMSRANGISETPFNIVRERAELTDKWERHF